MDTYRKRCEWLEARTYRAEQRAVVLVDENGALLNKLAALTRQLENANRDRQLDRFYELQLCYAEQVFIFY